MATKTHVTDLPLPASLLASPKGASPKGASPKCASPKCASPKPASPKTVSPQPASPKIASPKTVSPQTASPKAASPKDASPEDIAQTEPFRGVEEYPEQRFIEAKAQLRRLFSQLKLDLDCDLRMAVAMYKAEQTSVQKVVEARTLRLKLPHLASLTENELSQETNILNSLIQKKQKNTTELVDLFVAKERERIDRVSTAMRVVIRESIDVEHQIVPKLKELLQFETHVLNAATLRNQIQIEELAAKVNIQDLRAEKEIENDLRTAQLGWRKAVRTRLIDDFKTTVDSPAYAFPSSLEQRLRELYVSQQDWHVQLMDRFHELMKLDPTKLNITTLSEWDENTNILLSELLSAQQNHVDRSISASTEYLKECENNLLGLEAELRRMDWDEDSQQGFKQLESLSQERLAWMSPLGESLKILISGLHTHASRSVAFVLDYYLGLGRFWASHLNSMNVLEKSFERKVSDSEGRYQSDVASWENKLQGLLKKMLQVSNRTALHAMLQAVFDHFSLMEQGYRRYTQDLVETIWRHPSQLQDELNNTEAQLLSLLGLSLTAPVSNEADSTVGECLDCVTNEQDDRQIPIEVSDDASHQAAPSHVFEEDVTCVTSRSGTVFYVASPLDAYASLCTVVEEQEEPKEASRDSKKKDRTQAVKEKPRVVIDNEEAEAAGTDSKSVIDEAKVSARTPSRRRPNPKNVVGRLAHSEFTPGLPLDSMDLTVPPDPSSLSAPIDSCGKPVFPQSLLRRSVLDAWQQRVPELVRTAEALARRRQQHLEEELEAQITALKPRAGQIEVELYHRRSQELQHHRSSFDRHVQKSFETLNAKLGLLRSQMREGEKETLRQLQALRQLAVCMNTASSSGTLRHLLTEATATHKRICGELVQRFVSEEEESRQLEKRSLGGNNSFLNSFKGFDGGGEYNEEEVKFFKGNLKRFDDEIRKRCSSLCNEINSVKEDMLNQGTQAFGEFEREHQFHSEDVFFVERFRALISQLETRILAETSKVKAQTGSVEATLQQVESLCLQCEQGERLPIREGEPQWSQLVFALENCRSAVVIQALYLECISSGRRFPINLLRETLLPMLAVQTEQDDAKRVSLPATPGQDSRRARRTQRARGTRPDGPSHTESTAQAEVVIQVRKERRSDPRVIVETFMGVLTDALDSFEREADSLAQKYYHGLKSRSIFRSKDIHATYEDCAARIYEIIDDCRKKASLCRDSSIQGFQSMIVRLFEIVLRVPIFAFSLIQDEYSAINQESVASLESELQDCLQNIQKQRDKTWSSVRPFHANPHQRGFLQEILSVLSQLNNDSTSAHQDFQTKCNQALETNSQGFAREMQRCHGVFSTLIDSFVFPTDLGLQIGIKVMKAENLETLLRKHSQEIYSSVPSQAESGKLDNLSMPGITGKDAVSGTQAAPGRGVRRGLPSLSQQESQSVHHTAVSAVNPYGTPTLPFLEKEPIMEEPRRKVKGVQPGSLESIREVQRMLIERRDAIWSANYEEFLSISNKVSSTVALGTTIAANLEETGLEHLEALIAEGGEDLLAPNT